MSIWSKARPKRCPRWEFKYAWDGRFCNHCHFPHAKRENWDEFTQLKRFQFAHVEADPRTLRKFECACVRPLIGNLPEDAAISLDILERDPSASDLKRVVAEASRMREMFESNQPNRNSPESYAHSAFFALVAQFSELTANWQGTFAIAASSAWAHSHVEFPLRPVDLEIQTESPVAGIERLTVTRVNEIGDELAGEAHRESHREQDARRMIADYENRRREAAKKLEAIQCDLFRDVVRFPFDEQTEHPQWKTSTVRDLAWTMFETNDFAAMPILADAFQDAGCEDAEMIAHCLRPAPHVRGCWVVDWILGKADL